MNDLDILRKTKEILGDYALLCQNTNISITDFMAARQEAIYELQMPEYRGKNDLPGCTPSMPNTHQFRLFTGTADENFSTGQERQNFDPFAQSPAPPSQNVPHAGENRQDLTDEHAADMSVTITNGRPSGNSGQPARNIQNDVAEDPFFTMIKKIKD